MLLCTSRSADAPKALYILTPARNRYFFTCHGREAISRGPDCWKRPVRFRSRRSPGIRRPPTTESPIALPRPARDPTGRAGRWCPGAGSGCGHRWESARVVRPDDRVPKVAEELIVVVEVRRALRPHVGGREIAPPAAEVAASSLELPVARGARAREAQLAAIRDRHRMYRARPSLADNRVLKEQPASEPLIPLEVANGRLRRAAGPRPRVANVDGGPVPPSASNLVTTRRSKEVNASTLSGVRCTNLPDPSPQNRAALGQHRHSEAAPGRPVEALHHRFAVHAQPELKRQARADAPSVLREGRKLGALHVLHRGEPRRRSARRAIRPAGGSPPGGSR